MIAAPSNLPPPPMNLDSDPGELAGACAVPSSFDVPLTHPDDMIRCDIAPGFSVSVPALLWANAQVRERLHAPNLPMDVRADERARCSQRSAGSFLYWLSVYGATFRVRQVDERGIEIPITGSRYAPFIPWPCQVLAGTALVNAILQGHSLALNKSRDMGASWLTIAAFQWAWQFLDDVSFAEISYEEALVDNGDDVDALFGKHMVMIDAQPGWLVPPFDRRHLYLGRQDGRGRIVGKATTGRKGRAGRSDAVLIDEAAFVRELRPLWVSLEQTTRCRIVCSTVNGPNYFWTIVSSNKVQVVNLPWWDHPGKGVGRYIRSQPGTGTLEVRSAWYDAQERKALDALELSQELGMDPHAGGQSVFNAKVLNLAISRSRLPFYAGALSSNTHLSEDTALRNARERDRSLPSSWVWVDRGLDTGDDEVRLWLELERDEHGLWRPNQHRTYVVGIDIGMGTGASNSAMAVWDADEQRKVGEVVSPRFSPDDWARKAMALGYWLGGVRGCAYLCWESNGPGGVFWQVVKRMGYPWIFQRRQEDRLTAKVQAQPGWHSTTQTKKDLILEYAAALKNGRFDNPSRRALEEARSWVWYDNGDVGVGNREDMTTGARSAHGDIVIADALAWYAQRECQRNEPEELEPPMFSPSWRERR